jgi:hypothetical protein
MKCPLCHQDYETAPVHCAASFVAEPYDMDPDGTWFTLSEEERARIVREAAAAIDRIKTERKAAQQ